jgi:hypothetical protein
MVTGTPIPGPLAAVPGCAAPRHLQGQARQAARALGPPDWMGVAWAAAPRPPHIR